MRIGIGHPGDKQRVVGHVLKDFSKAEAETIDRMTDAIAQAVPLLAKDDDSGFMTKVSLILNPPEHKPKPGAAPDGATTDGSPTPKRRGTDFPVSET